MIFYRTQKEPIGLIRTDKSVIHFDRTQKVQIEQIKADKSFMN